MAAIVCLESHLVESRIHRLRLNSPKSKPKPTLPIDVAFESCLWEPNTKLNFDENMNAPSNPNPNQGEGGGWSFIESLYNASRGETSTYVHPEVKKSSVRLSPESLELCTENLGNETGTDITDTTIGFFSNCYYSSDSESYGGNGNLEATKTRRQVLGEKKKSKPRNYPPPLTTMRGSESLQVRPHREGGRLVIEVTKVPSTASCFHAERSDGRLRLCLLENPSFEDDEMFESEMMGEQRQDMDDEDEEKEDAETEEGETDRDEYWMRMENKYERGGRRRCKEGDRENNELLLINHWGKSLWVVTS